MRARSSSQLSPPGQRKSSSSSRRLALQPSGKQDFRAQAIGPGEGFLAVQRVFVRILVHEKGFYRKRPQVVQQRVHRLGFLDIQIVDQVRPFLRSLGPVAGHGRIRSQVGQAQTFDPGRLGQRFDRPVAIVQGVEREQLQRGPALDFVNGILASAPGVELLILLLGVGQLQNLGFAGVELQGDDPARVVEAEPLQINRVGGVD